MKVLQTKTLETTTSNNDLLSNVTNENNGTEND